MNGKRVIVTGAGGTIGRALSTTLRDAGAQVIGLDLTIPPDAPVPILACDLTDQAQVEQAVAAAVERLGGLDLLVNNAGIGGPAPAELAPDATVRRQLEVNLLAAWSTTAAALPALERLARPRRLHRQPDGGAGPAAGRRVRREQAGPGRLRRRPPPRGRHPHRRHRRLPQHDRVPDPRLDRGGRPVAGRGVALRAGRGRGRRGRPGRHRTKAPGEPRHHPPRPAGVGDRPPLCRASPGGWSTARSPTAWRKAHSTARPWPPGCAEGPVAEPEKP